MTLQNQWRYGPRGEPLGLEMAVFIPVIQANGWPLERALSLLAVIEQAMLKPTKSDDDG